jgi:hypothetical protein
MRGKKKCHLNKEDYTCVPIDTVHVLQVWSTKFKLQCIRKDELKESGRNCIFFLCAQDQSLLHRCCTAWTILTTRIKFVKNKRMLWAGRLSQVNQYTANPASVQLRFKQCALHSNFILNQKQNKVFFFCCCTTMKQPAGVSFLQS